MEDDTVQLPGRVGRDEVVPHVVGDRGRVALDRVAVAAGAGVANGENVGRRQLDVSLLRRNRRHRPGKLADVGRYLAACQAILDVALPDRLIGVSRAGVAGVDAQCGRDRAAAGNRREVDHVCAVWHDRDRAGRAADVPSRSTRVDAEPPVEIEERVVLLVLFDVGHLALRRVVGAGDRDAVPKRKGAEGGGNVVEDHRREGTRPLVRPLNRENRRAAHP